MKHIETVPFRTESSQRVQFKVSTWASSYIKSIANSSNSKVSKGVVAYELILWFTDLADDDMSRIVSDYERRAENRWGVGFPESVQKIKNNLGQSAVRVGMVETGVDDPEATRNHDAYSFPTTLTKQLKGTRYKGQRLTDAVVQYIESPFSDRTDLVSMYQDLFAYERGEVRLEELHPVAQAIVTGTGDGLIDIRDAHQMFANEGEVVPVEDDFFEHLDEDYIIGDLLGLDESQMQEMYSNFPTTHEPEKRVELVQEAYENMLEQGIEPPTDCETIITHFRVIYGYKTDVKPSEFADQIDIHWSETAGGVELSFDSLDEVENRAKKMTVEDNLNNFDSDDREKVSVFENDEVPTFESPEEAIDWLQEMTPTDYQRNSAGHLERPVLNKVQSILNSEQKRLRNL